MRTLGHFCCPWTPNSFPHIARSLRRPWICPQSRRSCRIWGRLSSYTIYKTVNWFDFAFSKQLQKPWGFLRGCPTNLRQLRDVQWGWFACGKGGARHEEVLRVTLGWTHRQALLISSTAAAGNRNSSNCSRGSTNSRRGRNNISSRRNNSNNNWKYIDAASNSSHSNSSTILVEREEGRKKRIA